MRGGGETDAGSYQDPGIAWKEERGEGRICISLFAVYYVNKCLLFILQMIECFGPSYTCMHFFSGKLRRALREFISMCIYFYWKQLQIKNRYICVFVLFGKVKKINNLSKVIWGPPIKVRSLFVNVLHSILIRHHQRHNQTHKSPFSLHLLLRSYQYTVAKQMRKP